MELEGEYRRFASTVASVDERDFRKRWLDGRCGVAEIVAVHVGCLDRLNGALRLASQGVRFEQIDWMDMERWQEVFYGLAVGKHKTTLLEELRQAFDRLIDTAIGTPEHRYSEDGLVARLFSYLGVCKFRLHASLIEAWRDGRLNSPGPCVNSPGPLAA
jgi:hypothetical protein